MRLSIAAALAATLLTASFASAQTTPPAAVPSSAATKAQEPFDKQVMQKITATLENKGITGVTNVRTDGDGYQVSAIQDTKPVQVWVNPESGEIRRKN